MKPLLKQTLRLAAEHVLGYLPRALRRRMRRGRVAILVYHEITPDLFAAHLEYLTATYNIVPLSQLAEAIEAGSLDGVPPDALILTFDDAWRSNYDLVPVLRRFGVQATIFVPTGLANTHRRIWNYTLDRTGKDRALNSKLKTMAHQDRLAVLRDHVGYFPDREYDRRDFLTLDEMRSMQDVIDFQAHSIYHPVLPTCTEAEAEEEITAPKAWLEAELGTQCYAFAYPYGRQGPRERALAKKAGYTLARAMNHPVLNSLHQDRYALKGIGTGEETPVRNLIGKLAMAELRTMLGR